MRFNNEKPIFTQIADLLVEDIIAGRLAAGARIPSAREIGASMEVNPNTAARALLALADAGIARCERGTGYFVADEGPRIAREERKRRFFEDALPGIFRAMSELDVEPGEIAERYTEWKRSLGK
jgi:DNA-binding transcriptional regulator YhcF (GntR family)